MKHTRRHLVHIELPVLGTARRPLLQIPTYLFWKSCMLHLRYDKTQNIRLRAIARYISTRAQNALAHRAVVGLMCSPPPVAAAAAAAVVAAVVAAAFSGSSSSSRRSSSSVLSLRRRSQELLDRHVLSPGFCRNLVHNSN